ncbi:MAG: glycosyltransferase [Gammaproteobacteria bacterium]|nr:glycosyltransferase [Gammaproteobacteria bacterium]
MNKEVSVVVPVYNEEDGLPLLFARLYPALDALGRFYEIVFVDDGSCDRSVALLREQFQRRPDVTRVIVLARNAGQHMAILAAFAHTSGRYVITLDADLQNPPEEIARLIDAMDAGADYVGTIRVSRQDRLWRKAASRFLNRLRERTTAIQITDQGCMLRGYHRSVVDAVNRCGEVSTYVPALAYTFARHPVEIEVSHAERVAGQSKYSLLRLIRLNFDLMTGFSVVPLQFFSMSGIVIALLSLLFVIYLAVRRLVVGPEAEGLFTLFGIAFFLIGVALIGLGVVGEYVGRIYEQVRERPRYTVAAVLGAESADPLGREPQAGGSRTAVQPPAERLPREVE